MIMKLKILLHLVLFVCVKSRPNAYSEILSYKNNIRPDGYDFNFETSDGISRTETGSHVPTGPEEGILTVVGKFSYRLPDGRIVSVTFNADANGYRPVVSITDPGFASGGEAVASGGGSAGFGGFADSDVAAPSGGFAPMSISGSAIATITGGGLGR